jgi:hypothetical protein
MASVCGLKSLSKCIDSTGDKMKLTPEFLRDKSQEGVVRAEAFLEEIGCKWEIGDLDTYFEAT